MVRLPFRKLAILIFSLALLAPGSAQAFPLTEWLVLLFGDIGCSWDPDGGCRDTDASQSDVGCSMDPDGRGCRG